ncbi:DNA helicase, ATP-dependent, RecQ type [Metarhizium album ARSEF 1941]|uniref:DNA helicase, ATP-dependent, RecQ type n=1 Tax=Metarhizium album (strain ARSEF 1941) TaxID=1081103 RepID=A0A0B2WKS0_METAS|nr:DNA helicase, ATP-dependent, RecQ type [Metarhizium album ARSEF 1941]KHN94543.1 DNA helicase, ATP-dependent, RecQ type [Metarhizium album ARSEF 1941]
MYSDYTPAFSLERKRTKYILTLLEGRMSNTLAAFPPEIRRLVARDLVREYAVINLHHLINTAPTVPDTVAIDLEHDVYASYVRIEGSTYVQSLHNKAPDFANPGCKHIHAPLSGQVVRRIFLEYDHLGIRGVHIGASTSSFRQAAGDVWWVQLRRDQGIRSILAVSDGLKVRGIMDGMEQDAAGGSIRAPAWPEPLTDYKLINLDGLNYSAFPPRGLRMSPVEFNASDVKGYLVAIYRRQLIKLQAHRHTASLNFYDDADMICKDLVWIYMPVDQGEYVKEIGALRCGGRPPSQLHSPPTLMLVTSRGRVSILGRMLKPNFRYTYSRIHEMGTSPSKVYLNEVDSARDGQRARYMGVHATTPTCWEKSVNPEAAIPKAVPRRFGQSLFFSCCRLENVEAVTPCCGKRQRHRPIIGMLLQYDDGTRSCVGQYRLDWALDPVVVQSELPMWIRQGELEGSKKFVSEVRLHGRKDGDNAKSWQEIPWHGKLEWWYSSQEASPPSKRRKRETEIKNGSNWPKRQRYHSNDTLVLDEEEDIVAVLGAIPDNVSSKQEFADSSAPMQVAQDLLTETFGHKGLRHEQEGAIRRILAGENVLAIFATDTAVALEQLDCRQRSKAPGEHGIIIVVSPLIALIKDQVDSLKRRGLPADCTDSSKSWEQLQQIPAALRHGKLRILCCAPERLNNEGFVETMRNVRGGVRLLAVDEAHCISEWSHPFRPEYLKVAEDICSAFKVQPEGVFRTSSCRPNLNLYARATKTKHDKYPHPSTSLSSSRRPRRRDTVGIKRVLDACDVRDDPRFLARIALGIKGPRVTRLKMDRHKAFTSLADHDSEYLPTAFTMACAEAARWWTYVRDEPRTA